MNGQKFDDDKLPLGVVIQKQFPNALKAIAKCSQYGHDKYKDDVDWLNFQRVDNWEQRYLNAFMRHFLEEGNDVSGLPHLYHAAWNLLCLLEMLEKNK
jgi:hypothetical protein